MTAQELAAAIDDFGERVANIHPAFLQIVLPRDGETPEKLRVVMVRIRRLYKANHWDLG